MTRLPDARVRRPARTLVLGLATAVGIAALAAPPAAFADRHGRKHRYYDDAYPAVYLPSGAAYGYRGDDDGDGYDYARVLDVRPIVTRVRVEEPRRECWDETRYEEPPPRPGVGGAMVVGGLIGGALGSQIGSGNGRRAATVAGAVIGTAIGHDVGERRRGAYGDYAPRPYTVQQCDVRYEQRWDERVDGYDVSYEYCGRRYRTRLPYDPGERLRIRVAVSPAEG
jgi:uncharacterized protein YcfJ